VTKFVLARAELFLANTTMADNLQDFSWLRDKSLRKDESNDVMKSLCQISNDNPFKVTEKLSILRHMLVPDTLNKTARRILVDGCVICTSMYLMGFFR
jgi:hypothetical protein